MEEFIKQAPVVSASLITVTTMVVLGIFNFWSNHIFRKDLEDLKQVLEVDKLLNESKKENSFGEYIRQRSNYISLIKTLNIKGFNLRIFNLSPTIKRAITFPFWSVLLFSMYSFMLSGIFDSITRGLIAGFILGLSIEGTKNFFSSDYYLNKVSNTRYWVRFKDGPLKGKTLHVPINISIKFNKESDLCYPFVAIKDDSKENDLTIYKLDYSNGSIKINSGQHTSMYAYYSFHSNESSLSTRKKYYPITPDEFIS